MPVLKAYYLTTATTAKPSTSLHDTVAMEQGSATSASPTALDPDGQIKATLEGAPAYMQHFYLLLKSSHDSNAAGLAELRSSHAANVTALAENTRVLAENARMLTSLSSGVDEVDQRQQTHSTRYDTDIARLDAVIARHNADNAAARSDIARNSTGNEGPRNRPTLDGPRQIIVRGIPLAVQLEPLPLANALLTALKLQQYAPLVIGSRAWNQPARAVHAEHASLGDQAAPAALPRPALTRALVFTLACAETHDDILRKTPGLKHLDFQAIFGTGGAAKLSVSALWPDPVYKLLSYATARHKQLGHLRPLVKNLTVFMRPTKNGPLLPVTCEADIETLVPQPQVPPPS